MTNDRQKMVDEVKELIDHHTKIDRGHTVDDTLFRLFYERGYSFPALKFDTMKIERVQRDTEWLNQLDRWHEREKDIDAEHELRPIVVVQYQGTFYLIDGNNRVTKWLRENSTKPRKVFILEPA